MLRVPHARSAVAVIVAIALALVLPVSPASAAAAVPAKPGLVNYVGASTTSLTVDWADIPGATSYYVYAGTSHAQVTRPEHPVNQKVTTSKATVTGLKPGVAYFIQVRGVSSAGMGPRSSPVAHETITAQATLPSTWPSYHAVSWNVCSNVCSGFSSRKTVIDRRIAELAPDIVGLQEASKYTAAPSGYRFAYNGQNDILIRNGRFAPVAAKSGGATSGAAVFPSTYAPAGKGMSWAAVRHSSSAYLLVVDTHLVVGTSASLVRQREYEAGKLADAISATLTKLNKTHRSLTDWTKAPVIVMGDFNTHKSRTGDKTMAVLEQRGWHDAYDQARVLSLQHYNTANPTMSLTPFVSVTWGDHIDKVLVRPSRSVVFRWANAGKTANGKWIGPLGSDHHPLSVRVGLR
ncbi:endonuclease/exonuclease/phosphatase family protein [Microbacterium sp. NPDC077663]|uniref:endonuclease/exonuclease/phosphatase family protein n=1 Tax=Microbacterium sp. NPDC077663 TaxID=3364189 RepID=UPI0037C90704